MSTVRKHAVVVVLGDFGRSPRMMYHTLSLANQADMNVSVLSYGGTPPRAEIENHERIHLYHVEPPAVNRSVLPYILYAIGKVVLQTLLLIYTFLFSIPHPHLVIAQTPPAIPTLAVLNLVCWLRGSRLIVDWHNLGSTLMQVSAANRWMVSVAYLYEKYFSR